MTDSNLVKIPQSQTHLYKRSANRNQKVIYEFLLSTVKNQTSELALSEFKHLFNDCDTYTSPEASKALYAILFENDEVLFAHTFKRSCYIFLNNWYAQRKLEFIRRLIETIESLSVIQATLSPSKKILNRWINHFVNSDAYEDLKLFEKLFTPEKRFWSDRYTSYLLVPQFTEVSNSIEQRQAARELYKELRDKFKRDFAMYTARCESTVIKDQEASNPTQLGYDAIQLVKRIASRAIFFDYTNYAHIFTQQIQNVSYKDFKSSFIKYLLKIKSQQDIQKLIYDKLFEKIESFYQNYNLKTLNINLMIRTCNRTIDCLMINENQEPSELFALLVYQDKPITLATILLKIILLCKYSRTHLDYCIAKLIRYHEQISEKNCKNFINFLEILNVMLAVYTENIHYNLVKVQDQPDLEEHLNFEPNAYRIFSQLQGADLHGVHLSGIDLSGVDLSRADLSRADLSGADLRQANLSLAKLNQTNLKGAMLDGAKLITTDLQYADLREASLKGANLRRANARSANFSSAILTSAILSNADLQEVNLGNSELEHADLSHANLTGSDLSHANLTHANLTHSDLKAANLYHANLTSSNLNHASLERVNLSRCNLSRSSLIAADLNTADLKNAHLYQANLREATLENANLTSIFGRGSCLSDANLKNANLNHADLSRADLRKADLSMANLTNISFRHTNLCDANLNHADLKGANLFSANLKQVSLEGTKLDDDQCDRVD